VSKGNLVSLRVTSFTKPIIISKILEERWKKKIVRIVADVKKAKSVIAKDKNFVAFLRPLFLK